MRESSAAIMRLHQKHTEAILMNDTTICAGADSVKSQTVQGDTDNSPLSSRPAMTVIDLAGQQVPIVKNGLYDRFRSNPPLSAIASEAPDLDLSWFRQLGKEKVDIGFESYSPNFYYRNSCITAVFTADLEQLKRLMPAQILEKVQPLQVWPGRGLIALTAYSYLYCDNDSYNEISLSIVTNQPRSANLGPLSLLGQSMANSFWGYVLKLPVDTELARVRGVKGYNLPKWVTPINYSQSEHSVLVEIYDSASNKLDLTIETQKLSKLSRKTSLITNGFTNIDQMGRLTTGYSISRKQLHASSSRPESVKLTLTDGSLSQYIQALKLGKLLKYEYVPEFQAALYAPKLL